MTESPSLPKIPRPLVKVPLFDRYSRHKACHIEQEQNNTTATIIVRRNEDTGKIQMFLKQGDREWHEASWTMALD